MNKNVALLLVLVLFMASCMIFANSASSSTELPENSWVSKAPMPTARAFFGVAVVDGKIYAIGGAGGVNEAYDPKTNTWTTKKPMPNPRTSFAIATYKNKIYCIGGYANGTNTGTATNEVYDPQTDTWDTKAPMPTVRSQLRANAVNGKIYAIGGIRDGGEILNLNEVYDPATDTWSAKEPIQYGVYSHSSVVIDNKIYVISGHSDFPGPSLLGPSNQIYDTEKDAWKLGVAPAKYAHRAAAVVTSGVLAPKRIYVIGGEVGFMEATNVNQVYDPQTDTWSTGASMPTARQGLGVAVLNDLIYAIGGSYPANGFSTSTSSDQNRQYTTLGNAKVTPVNFVPQEHCSVNEQYTPIGYGTPDPSYDGTAPEVTIVSPGNKTYHENDVQLNFTVSEEGCWMRYKLDNETAAEITGNTTITGLSYGSHSLTVYATDDAGNTGASQTIHFTIAEKPEPEPFPTAPVAAASVASVAIIGFGLLVYFKKRKH